MYILHLHQQAELLQVRHVWFVQRHVHQTGEVRQGVPQTEVTGCWVPHPLSRTLVDWCTCCYRCPRVECLGVADDELERKDQPYLNTVVCIYD